MAALRRRPDPDAAAVIVAGGKGLRFGGRIRKQYLALHRRPIVWWSLKAFEQCPSFGALVLVIPADDLQKLGTAISEWKFRKLAAVVSGGATRADSVRQGLRAVPPVYNFVAVHDAVRPLVTVAMIEKTLAEARRSGAAVAAVPSPDTVKLADGRHFVQSSPPRDTVWLAQTPQIFARSILERANRQGSRAKVTDDAQLVARLGVKVKLVESSVDNIKVTHASDLTLAQSILKKRKRR